MSHTPGCVTITVMLALETLASLTSALVSNESPHGSVMIIANCMCR